MLTKNLGSGYQHGREGLNLLHDSFIEHIQIEGKRPGTDYALRGMMMNNPDQ
ncbi:hypothetical protein MJ571_11215 [Klebsiella pneumoniae]|nr:hypothetical protein MJ571_11215 [Klebsiella pneumoniae]